MMSSIAVEKKENEKSFTEMLCIIQIDAYIRSLIFIVLVRSTACHGTA